MNYSLLAPIVLLSAGLLRAEEATSAGVVELFNGRDVSGWQAPRGTWSVVKDVSLDSADPKALVAIPGEGVLLNTVSGKAVDFKTEREFGDAQIHVEFCVAKDSNSGVYVQGRYEVQILDSYGKANIDVHDCAAIYERWDDAGKRGFEGSVPLVNAAKPPGEWQAYDITFLAPRFDAEGKKIQNAKFVKVLHNGQVVHENVEVTGPTRGGGREEAALGPIRLQGDHGPVAFRNLKVTSLSAR
ncbi:MAG: DUF1080 domain-containing protein [Verrucomicrobiota bacterium]